LCRCLPYIPGECGSTYFASLVTESDELREDIHKMGISLLAWERVIKFTLTKKSWPVIR